MDVLAARPLIYLITDGTLTSENLEKKSAQLLGLINSAIHARIPLIQLREKKLPTRAIFELAKQIADMAKGRETKIVINDRVDVALAAGSDGVHLTSRSIPSDVVRRYVPKNFLVGISAHSFDELESANKGKADFAVLAPIFGSPGKGAPIGLDVLRQAVTQTGPFPILGLGGINETNYHSVIDTGAAGFAAIRFLNNAENLEKLRSEFNL